MRLLTDWCMHLRGNCVVFFRSLFWFTTFCLFRYESCFDQKSVSKLCQCVSHTPLNLKIAKYTVALSSSGECVLAVIFFDGMMHAFVRKSNPVKSCRRFLSQLVFCFSALLPWPKRVMFWPRRHIEALLRTRRCIFQGFRVYCLFSTSVWLAFANFGFVSFAFASFAFICIPRIAAMKANHLLCRELHLYTQWSYGDTFFLSILVALEVWHQ